MKPRMISNFMTLFQKKFCTSLCTWKVRLTDKLYAYPLHGVPINKRHLFLASCFNHRKDIFTAFDTDKNVLSMICHADFSKKNAFNISVIVICIFSLCSVGKYIVIYLHQKCLRQFLGYIFTRLVCRRFENMAARCCPYIFLFVRTTMRRVAVFFYLDTPCILMYSVLFTAVVRLIFQSPAVAQWVYE